MHATEVHTADAISSSRAFGIDRRQAAFDLTLLADLRPAVLTALPLLAADLMAVLGSFALAWQTAVLLWPSTSVNDAPLAAGFCSAVFIANLAVGLYPGIGLSLLAEMRLSSLAAAFMGPIFLIVSMLQGRTAPPIQFIIVVTCCLLLVTLPLARGIARALFSRCAWWGQPVLIAGDDAAAEQTYSFLCRNPRFALRPLGIVGDWQANDGFTALRHLSRSGDFAEGLGAPWLVVAMPQRPYTEVESLVRRFGRQNGQHRMLVSELDGSAGLWDRASACLDWPGGYRPFYQTSLLRRFKRTIDIGLTVVGGLMLLPWILLIAVLVRFYSTGPALYCQERIGRDGRKFKAWKFRTMISNADGVLEEYLAAHPQLREEWERDHKLQDDPRVTRIGRLLRKTSLDELPQLWNVLRGEMSLVGPRPIVDAEVVKYGDSFEHFCSVSPGLTGLWQVSGRNNTTYAERVELDSYYARNWSPWLDLYILVLTVKVVLFREGAY